MCKDPPTPPNTHKHYDCLWHWSSLQRLHILCLKAVLVNHFAVLLALSLCGWRGEYIHSFIIPALKWILSNRGGGFGRMFKDLFHSRLSKGKNAVRSCWCKGIVKSCVFVCSCVEQVTFSADEGPLSSEKDCFRGVFKCRSDISSVCLRFSFSVWL